MMILMPVFKCPQCMHMGSVSSQKDLMCAGCVLMLMLCEVQIGFDVGLMANLLNTSWAGLTHMARNHLFMIMRADKIEHYVCPT